MLISPREIVEFFDVNDPFNSSHSSAVNAVAGEEMGVALLEHWLIEERNVVVKRLGTPTGDGAWLDRWLHVTGQNGAALYQVEVKNWTAHSIDGTQLLLDVDAIALQAYKIARWNEEWDANERRFRKKAVDKVLKPMNRPAGYETAQVIPVVCYWRAVHSTGGVEPFFNVDANSGDFPQVWVFSMSSYLRSLLQRGRETIELNLPRAAERLEILKRLFVAA